MKWYLSCSWQSDVFDKERKDITLLISLFIFEEELFEIVRFFLLLQQLELLDCNSKIDHHSLCSIKNQVQHDFLYVVIRDFI